ncbi:MAG: hypothetical protein HC918_02040 [Oscillatoriales cyanobacterium SM2_1_8]|nr:hypothetical protein [Oscillatoriales cyanobacterium SM2_1_8]
MAQCPRSNDPNGDRVLVGMMQGVPAAGDVVLSDVHRVGRAVLGGLAGARHRLMVGTVSERQTALVEIAHHGEWEPILRAARGDNSWLVRRDAYWLLPPNHAAMPHPYQELAWHCTLNLNTYDTVPVTDYVSSMAVGGDWLAVSTTRNTQLWHLPQQQRRHLLPVSGAVALTADGGTLFSGSGCYDGTLTAWQGLSDRPEPYEIGAARGAELDALALSGNGELLAAVSSYHRRLRVWQWRDRRLVYAGEGQSPLAVSGPYLLTGGRSIAVRKLGCGTLLRTVADGSHDWRALAISPTGQWLAVGGYDGTVEVRSLLSGHVAQRLIPPTEPAPVTALSISPEGQILVSGDYWGNVHFWHLKTGAWLRTLPPYPDGISALAFNGAGNTLLVGVLRRARIDLWSA